MELVALVMPKCAKLADVQAWRLDQGGVLVAEKVPSGSAWRAGLVKEFAKRSLRTGPVTAGRERGTL
jgi:hypothetical protein